MHPFSNVTSLEEVEARIENETSLIEQLESNPKLGDPVWKTEVKDAYWRRRHLRARREEIEGAD